MFVGDPVKQCWNQYFGETDALVELPTTSAVQSEDLSGNAALFTYVRLANGNQCNQLYLVPIVPSLRYLLNPHLPLLSNDSQPRPERKESSINSPTYECTRKQRQLQFEYSFLLQICKCGATCESQFSVYQESGVWSSYPVQILSIFACQVVKANGFSQLFSKRTL